MHPRHRCFTVPAFLAVAFCLAAWPLAAEEAPSDATPPTPTEAEATQDPADGAATSPALFFGGLRVFVDPETGRIVSDPPRKSLSDFTLDPVLLPRLRTSSEGLVEEPGPRGGVMVDLQGRFASATVAVIDADGNLRMDHVSLAGEASDEDAEEDTEEDTEEADDDTP